jgi:hypothetical protein
MANKADVDKAYWKGREEGVEWAAWEILRRLDSDASQEVRAVAFEVAQPDYYAHFDDAGEYQRDDIAQVKADRRAAAENYNKAVTAVFDAGKQLRDAAMLAAYLAAAEKDSESGSDSKRLIRPLITDPATARDNYDQMADKLFDETTTAIKHLLYTYSGRRLNVELAVE